MKRKFMSAQKLADVIADVRVDPNQTGREMAYLPLVIQERLFDLTLAYLRELSFQYDTNSFANGNMELAQRAWDIQETLLTFQTQP
jgi:hypothetical protein